MQTGAVWSFSVVAAAACLVACSPEPPEGRLKCRMASECPDRWFCRDNGHDEKRCYKTSGTNHDAGSSTDAGRNPRDAGLGSDAEVISTGGTRGQGTGGRDSSGSGGGGASGTGGAKPSGTGGTPASGGTGGSASGGTGGSASGSGGTSGGTGGTTPDAAKWDSSDVLWDTAVWQ